MPNFSYLHKLARHDVRICIQAWSETLRKFLGDRLEFIYVKGSAIKKWSSPIDYVPVLSYVDIHFRIADGQTLFLTGDTVEQAIQISTKHERRFFELEPTPLHFPRSQLILLNESEKELVPPRSSQIQPVVGTPTIPDELSAEKVREIDKANLKNVRAFLHELPLLVIDRAGFYYWSLIRRMVWYVSPTPYRLLTQIHDDPLDVWSCNRTKIVDRLEQDGYDTLAFNYRSFYMAGWDFFFRVQRQTGIPRSCSVRLSCFTHRSQNLDTNGRIVHAFCN